MIGQIISLFITGTGLTSSLLATNYSINIPTTQSFLNYFLLSFYLIYLAYDNHKERTNKIDKETLIENGSEELEIKDGDLTIFQILKKRGLIYFLLAIVDFEANFVVVMAYQYTSITSIMLLDCFTIPCVMILSYIFLKYRFKWLHILGAMIGISGIGLLVVGDSLTKNDKSAAPNPLLGDCLCLISSLLYSISNIAQEKIVSQYKRIEYLSFIGIFGCFVGMTQMLIFDMKKWKNIVWSWQVILLLIGFGICLFLMYTLVPTMMRISSAAFFNISLLTSDAYSILISIFIFKESPSIFYFIALALSVIGLLIYNAANNIKQESNLIIEEIKETSTDNN